MKELIILTESRLKDLYYDDLNLKESLNRRGIEIQARDWQSYRPIEGDRILIRTPWNYSLFKEDFLSLLNLIESKKCKVYNPVDLIRWNLNKRYLEELQKSGIKVVPTTYVDSFSLKNLDAIEFPFVVKPIVGASGRDTFLIKGSSDLSKLEVLYNQAVMIQPFVESIKSEGEFSFIYFDNEFSHAVQKTAKEGEFRIQDEHGGSVKAYNPTDEEISKVNKMLKLTNRSFLYVRVDVVIFNDDLYLMELEAFEPELFFRFHKESSEEFARKIEEFLF
ncbi:hypothetical protein HBN50_09985 [Halobacteriovorax sp. GB3]|uniref:ATP-grasp domain-containing protein n=1 Tax=Halobacteriovorax sp. GB3 TaxID=2719615 RepID=UPI0023627633|nr:hypothetical protein [Halobacteriovorax sp. GB3]MDD0853429.1 hypothetical protein [Halobacteriovorax sp. GB3]